jgi:hypothetical protein
MLATVQVGPPNRVFERHRVEQRVLDTLLGYLVLAVDALGVDLEQDAHAVPGPLGD